MPTVTNIDMESLTTQIELKQMVFHAFHGVDPQERKVGNRFVVDLLLTLPLEKAMESDDLNDTVNYALVYEVVKKEMEIPSNLIEHAAGRIVRSLHDRFPQISIVRLKLSKINPPIGADMESAAIIVEKIFD